MTPDVNTQNLPFPVISDRTPQPTRGRLVSLSGYTGLLILTGVWILGFGVAMEVWGELAGLTLLLISAPLVFAGFPFFIQMIARGRRMRAPSALDRLAQDPRPPVVFLRSFNDDDLIDPSFTTTYKFVPGRYEERLINALSPLGPAVALGRPGEPAPELGAARLYVKDADWQRAIRYFMERAGVVVAIVGGSPGLWWEIQLAIEHVPFDRLLFFFPYPASQKTRGSYWHTAFLQNPVWGRFVRRRAFPEMNIQRKQRYVAFREQINAGLPHLLPESLGNSRFVCFTKDGQARLIEPAKPALLTRVLTLNFEPELDIPFRRELREFVVDRVH